MHVFFFTSPYSVIGQHIQEEGTQGDQGDQKVRTGSNGRRRRLHHYEESSKTLTKRIYSSTVVLTDKYRSHRTEPTDLGFGVRLVKARLVYFL